MFCIFHAHHELLSILYLVNFLHVVNIQCTAQKKKNSNHEQLHLEYFSIQKINDWIVYLLFEKHHWLKDLWDNSTNVLLDWDKEISEVNPALVEENLIMYLFWALLIEEVHCRASKYNTVQNMLEYTWLYQLLPMWEHIFFASMLQLMLIKGMLTPFGEHLLCRLKWWFLQMKSSVLPNTYSSRINANRGFIRKNNAKDIWIRNLRKSVAKISFDDLAFVAPVIYLNYKLI